MMIRAIVAALLAGWAINAVTAAPRAPGIESGDYRWNVREGEQSAALKLKGDRKRGEEVYEVCVACHLPSGAGRPDGSIPQLAGQHRSVLIKQMADIRAGVRDNPLMYPFAATLTEPQELADVAAYIEGLCVTPEHGRYAGPDAARQVSAGRQLYEKACRDCHGAKGEGDAERFHPRIAGQHYRYLLRQMTEIRDGHRRNANPEMVRVIVAYSDEQLVALSAYQASLVVPGSLCRAAPAKSR
ncbi:c-type cytochrome [Accumulibacter sp.]|uniref:c-type cytochrome n=1 Tax=Accumulibacter sp. TaxID=2053492 RepID=UPI0025DCD154|nr:c-type cytochrome [Accumulibacter sp.]MCM8626630.1 c-type cytochrome [Accumulibacter sp.]